MYLFAMSRARKMCADLRAWPWGAVLLSVLMPGCSAQGFTQEPANTTVEPGDDFLIDCVTTQDLGGGTVFWTRGTTTLIPLTVFPRYSLEGDTSQGNYSLSVKRATYDDANTWQCQVGSYVSVTAQVTVADPTTVAPSTTPEPTTTPPTSSPATDPPGSGTTKPPTGNPPPPNPVSWWVVIVFVCQALLAAILIIAILSLMAEICKCTWTCCICTETCCCCCTCTCTCGAMNLLACMGPLVGVLLAIAVIIMAVVEGGNERQQGFLPIVLLSAGAAVMSIAAAIGGFLFKSFDNGMNLPVSTMLLEFSLGLTIAIAGIVVSAVYLQGDEGVAVIAIGSVCIVILAAAFIWFMCCVRKQSSKVSQDLSEIRSQHQVELQQQSLEDAYRPAHSAANNEKE